MLTRTTTVLAIVAVFAAICALTASAAKQPTAVQRTAITSAVQRFWCSYIPKNEGPCSRWTVHVPSVLVSTVDPSWGLARMTDRTAGKTALPAGFNVFVHKGGKMWKVFKWFSTLRGLTCAAAAREAGVPEPVVNDFGLCATIVRLP